MNIAAGFLSLFDLKVLYVIFPSYLFNVISSILLNLIVFEPLGLLREMELPSVKGGVFRPLKSMLYHPFLSPVVHTTLQLFLSNSLFGEESVKGWGSIEAVAFSVLVWFCTSFHGIWLDYTTFRISETVLISFLLGSLVTAVVTGYCVGSFY